MSDKKFSLDPLSYGTNLSAYRMPDPMKYKVGDIVYLVSGGPPMTVRSDNDNGRTNSTPKCYECDWFYGDDGVVKSGNFREEMLTDIGSWVVKGK